jgi:hypothetical protein
VQRMKLLKRLVGVHDTSARCFKGSKPLQMLPNFANISSDVYLLYKDNTFRIQLKSLNF